MTPVRLRVKSFLFPILWASLPSLCLAGAGQDRGVDGIAPPPTGPVMAYERTSHDFGIVSPRGQVECEFRFTNQGSEDLNITRDIESVCGCTVPTLAKRRYAPGESGRILVTFTATGTIARVTKEIQVYCDDPLTPRTTLTIKAHVTPRVVCEPDKILLLPRRDNGDCPPILLRSIDGVPFSITGVSSSQNCLTASFAAERTATEFTLQPVVDTQRARVPSTGFLVFALARPDCREARVGFQVLPEYQFEPQRLALYGAEPNRVIERSVLLKSNYGEAFEIVALSSEKGLIAVTGQEALVDVAEGRFAYRLDLAISPTPPARSAGSAWDTLVVQLSDGHTVKLPCPMYFSSGRRAR